MSITVARWSSSTHPDTRHSRNSSTSLIRCWHSYNIKYSLDTWLANQTTAKGVVTTHDRLPNWNPKNGGMLISQPVTSCLTNHSELCMSRPRNNQSRRISIYILQRRPSFGFESSVSSTSMTSGDPVDVSNLFLHHRPDSGGLCSPMDSSSYCSVAAVWAEWSQSAVSAFSNSTVSRARCNV